MELWLQEEMRQRRAMQRIRHFCAVCGEPLTTARCLPLPLVGSEWVVCERCVERCMVFSDMVMKEVCP